MRKEKRFFFIIACIVTFLGTGLIAGAEIGLRLFYKHEQKRSKLFVPSKDEILIYEQRPFFYSDYDGIEIKTGRWGWRDYVEGHESETLLIGDSIAFGYGLNSSSAIHSILRIDSAGIIGYSLSQVRRQLELLPSSISPKKIIYLYCMNDPISVSFGPSRFFLRGRSALAQRTRDFVLDLRYRISGNDYYSFLHQNATSRMKSDFQKMVEVSKSIESSFLVAVVPVLAWGEPEGKYAWRWEVNEVCSMVTEAGGECIDLLPALHDEASTDVALPGDWVHPNALGARKIADALRKYTRY